MSNDATTPAAITVDQAGPVEVSCRSVSAEGNMAYLLVEVATGAALLVDAADDAPTIRGLVAAAAERASERGTPLPRVETIVTTHQHWDHHRALAELTEEWNAATAAGDEDAAELPVEVDRHLHQGDTVAVGGVSLEVAHLRGHTPGSIALALVTPGQAPRLFTGDSLFPGGVGNTWQDPERFASLIDDVEQRLFEVYPDESIVYPGHGAATTLGTERPHLAEWRERGW